MRRLSPLSLRDFCLFTSFLDDAKAHCPLEWKISRVSWLLFFLFIFACAGAQLQDHWSLSGSELELVSDHFAYTHVSCQPNIKTDFFLMKEEFFRKEEIVFPSLFSISQLNLFRLYPYLSNVASFRKLLHWQAGSWCHSRRKSLSSQFFSVLGVGCKLISSGIGYFSLLPLLCRRSSGILTHSVSHWR